MTEQHEDPRPDVSEPSPESGPARRSKKRARPSPLELAERVSAEGEAAEPASDDAESAATREEACRRAKVAEARIKILNGYYARSDIQKKLAERLIFELGA